MSKSREKKPEQELPDQVEESGPAEEVEAFDAEQEAARSSAAAPEDDTPVLEAAEDELSEEAAPAQEKEEGFFDDVGRKDGEFGYHGDDHQVVGKNDGKGGYAAYRQGDDLEIEAHGGAENGGHGGASTTFEAGGNQGRAGVDYTQNDGGDTSVVAAKAGTTLRDGDDHVAVDASGHSTLDGSTAGGSASVEVEEDGVVHRGSASAEGNKDGVGVGAAYHYGEGEGDAAESLDVSAGADTRKGGSGKGSVAYKDGDTSVSASGDGTADKGGQGGGAVEVEAGDTWSAKVSGRVTKDDAGTTTVKTSAGAQVHETSATVTHTSQEGAGVSVQDVAIDVKQGGIDLGDGQTGELGLQGEVRVDEAVGETFDVTTSLKVVEGDESRLDIAVTGGLVKDSELATETGTSGGSQEDLVGRGKASVVYNGDDLSNTTEVAAGGGDGHVRGSAHNRTVLGGEDETKHTIDVSGGFSQDEADEFEAYGKAVYEVLTTSGHQVTMGATFTLEPGDDGYDEVLALQARYKGGISPGMSLEVGIEVGIDGGPVAFEVDARLEYEKYYARTWVGFDTTGDLSSLGMGLGYDGVAELGVEYTDAEMQGLDFIPESQRMDMGGQVMVGITFTTNQ